MDEGDVEGACGRGRGRARVLLRGRGELLRRRIIESDSSDDSSDGRGRGYTSVLRIIETDSSDDSSDNETHLHIILHNLFR